MPKPRSVQAPQAYLVRGAFRFADPTGFLPQHWRLVAREPVNKSAQRFIARELCALSFMVSSPERGDKRVERYNEEWDGLFEQGDGFDVWVARMVEDTCTLPFGGASEVGYNGDDLAWVLHVDAGTLMPTYEKSKPYCQVHPDDWTQRVYFTRKQLRRLRINPRTDIRFKEYQVAPTEDAFMGIEALAKIYLYYMQQLADTPPPGILDVMDMAKEDAEEWAMAFRELIEGVDAIKIPLLYDHTTPAKWIPFGRSPNELNILEQFKRFAELVLSKYGLSIGDLRLFDHEATKAGERVSQLVTERSGIGFWASAVEAYLTRLLPNGLVFKFKQPRPERELVVAQRQQTQLATLQAATGNKALMEVADALEQAKDWEVFSVDIKEPEPEPVPPALAGGNGKEPPTPTQEEIDQTEEARDQFDDTDLANKAALLVKADLGEWKDPPPTAVEELTMFLADQFVEAGGRANEAQIDRILAKVREQFIEEPETSLEPEEKGGAGSGHHGHGGRPGKRGGSASGNIGTAILSDWYTPPKLNRGVVGTLAAEGKGDTYVMANELGLKYDLNAFARDNQRWTMGADASAKEDIAGWLTTGRGVRELTLYNSWSAGDSALGFEEWLDKPQTYYRGGGRSDVFMSFASSERVARDASKAASVFSVSLKPSQLLGSAMTGAGEVYVDSDMIEQVISKGGAEWAEKADVDELDELIESLLEGDDWWAIPDDRVAEVEDALSQMSRAGLDVEAGRIEKLQFGLSETPSVSIDWDLRDPRVADLIESQGLTMVTNVNEGTKYYLRQIIKEAVEEGFAGSQVVKSIQSDIFGLPTGEASKFTRERLMSIVNYETNKAMSQSSDELRRSLGLKLKQWFTNRVSPCDICLWNAEQGPVDVKFEYRGVFGSIMYPPAHPRTCRCVSTAVESEVRSLGKGPIEWPFTMKALVQTFA